jgi:hypothetical protein
MKRFSVCLLAGCFLLAFCIPLSAADEVKKTSDKTVSGTVTDTAKDVKTGAVKVYQESKEAVVRDARAMKEDIPKGLKEAKESAIQQSRDAKESAAKELKEIRDNMANPTLTPKTNSK